MKSVGTVILVSAMLCLVPAQTGWILNGARADAVVPLQQNMEKFRSFDIPAEQLKEQEPFSLKKCRTLALMSMYGKDKVPKTFTWQIEKECLEQYTDGIATVLSDVSCFPIALDGVNGEKVTFENSWGTARNYGGERRHEGVDLMTSNNVPGYFPAVSVCDGVVEKLGWLELGGYRIGIRSEHGLYVYYAHLDSYAPNLKIGDVVEAGDVLGYVGNTGYGPEGTKGKFDVHLHFGLYVDIEGEEVSVNPYEILRYLEM